jgi:hypothetical protein
MSGMLALALLAAVELGGAFGSASAATVTLETTTMVVDLEVEVIVSAESVVAHLSGDDDAILVPLVSRGGGIYGIRTEVPRQDHIVVFEVIGPNGGLSDPATLSQLGADLVVAPEDVEPDEGLDSSTTRWGWLGLALGAASLSLLAFWVLGDRDRQPAEEEE